MRNCELLFQTRDDRYLAFGSNMVQNTDLQRWNSKETIRHCPTNCPTAHFLLQPWPHWEHTTTSFQGKLQQFRPRVASRQEGFLKKIQRKTCILIIIDTSFTSQKSVYIYMIDNYWCWFHISKKRSCTIDYSYMYINMYVLFMTLHSIMIMNDVDFSNLGDDARSPCKMSRYLS